MTKIDIFSGFLGAGKTTLIKKLLSEAFQNEKIVIIENEFGEIGIDGGFLKDAGIEITEMNSGCICCSLVGDFAEALKKVLKEYSPDRILIEPSGVGKLSDVIKAVKGIEFDSAFLGSSVAVVDAKKCKMYTKNFGEFYNDQIENAGCIVLSHTKGVDDKKIRDTIALIRGINKQSPIVATDWDELDGCAILEAMEGARTLDADVERFEKEKYCPQCDGLHHHHDEHCECGHEHHHHDEHCECGHGHHHHDEHCECGHEHHHHDKHCECGLGHHHHHHADGVFASWGIETATKYSKEYIEKVLHELENTEKYGVILRAKGIVAGNLGKWIHFDFIPSETDVRFGSADIIGRICVIGSNIKRHEIEKLFDFEDNN